MGWTSEQALHEDLNYFAAADAGRVEMFQAIGLIHRPEPKPASIAPSPSELPVLTPSAFDMMFGGKG